MFIFSWHIISKISQFCALYMYAWVMDLNYFVVHQLISIFQEVACLCCECICAVYTCVVHKVISNPPSPCTLTFFFYNAHCIGLSVSYTPSQRAVTPSPVLYDSSISFWLSTPRPQFPLETDSNGGVQKRKLWEKVCMSVAVLNVRACVWRIRPPLHVMDGPFLSFIQSSSLV